MSSSKPGSTNGKVAGPQPHGDFAIEDGAEQRLHEVDEMGDGDVAIDHHAFELIEGVLVRGVHFFVAEDAAGRDHAQRRTEALHAAHLHGRSVGAQQIAVGEPERILHVARGMVGGDVQRVEIVDIRSSTSGRRRRRSPANEEVFDLGLDLRDGMQMADPRAGCGEGEIDPLGIEAEFEGLRIELAQTGFQAGFDVLFGGIEQLAGARAVFGRHLAHFFADLRERAFAAEHFYAHLLQVLQRTGGLDTGQGGGFEVRQLLFKHRVPRGARFSVPAGLLSPAKLLSEGASVQPDIEGIYGDRLARSGIGCHNEGVRPAGDAMLLPDRLLELARGRI
jgi:hypothetical protein